VKHLYLKLYLALLASLLVFAAAAAALWHASGGWEQRQGAVFAQLAANILPPASAAAAEQQAALQKIAAGIPGQFALLAPDGTRLAQLGGDPGSRAHRLKLADGRVFVARPERRGLLGVLAALALILVAVGAGAYPVVRRLTRRIERLQGAVESLGSGTLSARVEVQGCDEVAGLAQSFNRAAERIEALVGAQKSLLANTSHELRTPLARIRMGVELKKDPKDIERDIAELDALIEELLLAGRLDAEAPLELDEVDLLGLAAEECARYEGVSLEGEHVKLRGDARLLRRMLRNLLENAVRHGRPPILVLIKKNQIHVRDAGPPIPDAEKEKLFEPFYRRSSASTGAGLGLAIVRQIARRHGGEARYEGGFVVDLP
jgi:signal transduction histidine kinase